jgi:hypothetical protein
MQELVGVGAHPVSLDSASGELGCFGLNRFLNWFLVKRGRRPLVRVNWLAELLILLAGMQN